MQSKKKEWYARQVANELKNKHEALLEKFLRTLIEDQINPSHPVITREKWDLTWNSIF